MINYKILSTLNTNYLNEKFQNYESLLTKSGKLNATLVRYQILFKLDIYKKLLEETKHLESIFGTLYDSERIQFVLGKAKIEQCNVCNAPYIQFSCSQRRLTTCNHKQRYNEKSSKRLKKNRQKNLQAFYHSLHDKKIYLKDENFNKRLFMLSKKQANYAFTAFSSEKDFYHDLIIKTEKVIPIDEKDLKIGHRIYLAANNIYSPEQIPVCKYCGKPSYFKNRLVGYAESCIECSRLKNNETRIINIRKRIDDLIDKDKYEVVHYPELVNKDFLIVKCKKCDKESSIQINNGKMKLLKKGNLCKHCEKPKGSKDEEELLQFIKSFYQDEIVHGINSRKIIAPYELDFYFPNCKVAIEYNGIYWHSCAPNRCIEPEKHRIKTDICLSKNIKLFQLFSDEWHQKKDICKKYIKNLLGYCIPLPLMKNNATFMRIVEINNNVALHFHNQNNIQGSIKAKYHYGFYILDRLYAVMSFKKVKKTDDYEIVRISWDLSYKFNEIFLNIVKQFVKDHKTRKILFYHDRRFPMINFINGMQGMLLYKIQPKFWYCNNTERYDRNIKIEKIIKYAKNNISGNTLNLTNSEIMEKAGIKKIFDCGIDVYAFYCK